MGLALIITSLVFLNLSLGGVPVLIPLVHLFHSSKVDVESLSGGLLLTEVLVDFSVKALFYLLLVLNPVVIKVLVEELDALSIHF